MLQTRMQELTLDRELYQEWLAALLQDWNPASNNNLDAANRQDLQSVWYLWQDLGQLAILPLQEDLEEYWKNQSQQMMEGYRAGSYLQFAYDKHVHVTIWQPWLPSQWLRSVLENCFFQPHLNDQYLLKPENLHPILQSELFAIKTVVGVSSTAMEKLSSTQQLWTLAGRIVGGQRLVATSIAKFAKTQGLACVQPAVELSDGAGKAAVGQHILDKSPIPATNNVQIVSDLLDTQQRISRLIQSLPHGPELIILKNVWEEVLNVETTPALAELLAKFLDQILRSNKKMDQYQSESEQWLQRIISGLFIPLQAKDIFEAFYKRDLAKRLLWNRVVNMDVEKQVCSLLKAECGAGFTSKMEGMFQDVDWSRETMMVYKQSTADILPTENSVEMEAQVLTTGT
jgi:cullin-4